MSGNVNVLVSAMVASSTLTGLPTYNHFKTSTTASTPLSLLDSTKNSSTVVYVTNVLSILQPRLEIVSCVLYNICFVACSSILLFILTQDIGLAMPFSRRNGFGKVHCPTKLSTQLHTFTAVEEAAIRQIVPLQSIIRLGHGNLASKGNTYCVYKKSKLHTVLPLLPSECNYIVVTRTSKQDGKLKSTKFKRYKIGHALELLEMTCLDVWNIQIDQTRLNQWPEEGDFVT